MKWTSKSYAKDILNKIKSGIHIEMYTIDDEIREKNLEFMEKYNLNIKDVKECIYNLKEKNFKYMIKTEDLKIPSEYLYVFEIALSLENELGMSDLINIYMKLGYLNIEDEMILVVSFHD